MKNVHRKKGAVEISLLMAGIVATIVLFLGLIFVKQIINSEGEFASREICRQSVQRHADLHIKSYNPPSSTINCPPVYIDFAKDKINYEYRDTKKSVKLPKDGKNKETAIKKAMADEIYFCWNQFLEGKRDLFGGPKKYCNICSVMRFEDKNTDVKGFYDYILKTTVPNEAMAKEGVTYFDYMQGYSKKAGYDQALLAQYKTTLEGTEIDPNNAYAVIFVYAKSEPLIDNSMEFLNKYWETNGAKVAVVGGVVLIAGGVILGMTGVGAPGGGVLIAIGIGIARQVIMQGTIDAGVDAAAEAYLKMKPVRDWTAFTVFGPYDETLLKGLGCEELSQR